jgi:hypothetical protein
MTPNIRPEFFGPRDNFALADDDWHRIELLCDRVAALRQGRSEYLRQRGLDPELYLPAHLWGQDFVPRNFDRIASKDRHAIRHLRFLTYNFTGFSLLRMAASEDTELLVVPDDVDAQVRRAARNAHAVTVGFVRDVQGLPRERIVATPRLFGESGWDVDGTIVNYDTWSTQQRLNGLHGSGVLDWLQRRRQANGRVRVVEIGAGFGNLAHALMQTVGPIDYTIVDLADSLIYSTIWLTTVRADVPWHLVEPGDRLATAPSRVTFLANHLLDEFLPQLGNVDLVINTLSLSEMSPAQVALYARIVKQLIGDDGVFYEQNYIEPGVQTEIRPILAAAFGHRALLRPTQPPHGGRGEVRMWSNRYCGELWNGGAAEPLVIPNAATATLELPRPRVLFGSAPTAATPLHFPAGHQ